jgi:hypothetical protein
MIPNIFPAVWASFLDRKFHVLHQTWKIPKSYNIIRITINPHLITNFVIGNHFGTFFCNPGILTALCGWNLDRKFWVFLQMLNDFKTRNFRSINQPPIAPELIHFHQKCISSKFFAKTLLEMMSLITLCDFWDFHVFARKLKISDPNPAQRCYQNRKTNRNQSRLKYFIILV